MFISTSLIILGLVLNAKMALNLIIFIGSEHWCKTLNSQAHWCWCTLLGCSFPRAPAPCILSLHHGKKSNNCVPQLFPISKFYLHFQDEEDVKAIARLFADMGDSYVELIATGILLLITIQHPLIYASNNNWVLFHLLPHIIWRPGMRNCSCNTLNIMYFDFRFWWINVNSACIAGSCFTPGIWYCFNDVQLLAQSSGELDQKVRCLELLILSTFS